ncbi:dTDP-4-dehydrorhamnose 3,5-epimerase [Elongatibacter sediminis]|uniref:dTDP-4-dehydrorhamnose 3,5-epimerase n=1 Tax=Elongatibacter sediminis TaxID=3119006 RepID=A0AAW9RAA8_9GAMM
MNCIETGIPGLVVIEPDVHGDDRGYFKELWNTERFRDAGLPGHFAQSNVSRSGAGVVRGLHYQYPHPQGKLVSVLEGRIFDVAVDIRADSPTFRRWAGVELSAGNHRQLYVPEGFAHGFCVLGESALITYLCTTVYRADSDAAVAWDDPDIGIDWPIEPTQISQRDRAAPRLRQVAPEDLPRMAV